MMSSLAELFMKDRVHVPVVPSHKIEQKKEVEQLSKRKLARAKGKKARKNRGQNREHQDTTLYASLRR